MQLGLIGFGEAAQAFARGWAEDGTAPPVAFDLRAVAPIHGVSLGTRADVLSVSTAVFCLVTADNALLAAEQCAPFLRPGTFWLDGNSCAPQTKRQAAEAIQSAGGQYVDTAIMAPVHPRLHRTPILLSGPAALAGAELLSSLGMAPKVVGESVGHASSIKMIRSVMIKGMEALYAECFLAARKAGVGADVIGSLIGSNPEINWHAQGAYNLERMMSHGIRRAAEMREVVVTLRDLGFAGDMTAAVADWQDRIGRMGLKGVEGDLWERTDLALTRL